jgi:uncharacterized membrane protein YhaH (DUF805 family)
MGDPAPAGFGFRGRIGRAQYWAQMLVVVLGVNGPTINSSARGSAWHALSRTR